VKVKASLILTLFASVFVNNADAVEKSVNWNFVREDNAKIFMQNEHKNSCGYAALLNNLSYGDDEAKKLLNLIDGKTDEEKLTNLENRFDFQKSMQYPEGGRMRSDGICAIDLLQTANDLRKDQNLKPLDGLCLERRENESKSDMGIRIHRLLLNSIDKGEPPVILIRAETAHFRPRLHQTAAAMIGLKAAFKKSSKWDAEKGHFVTVIGLPQKANEDGSFCLEFVDPSLGKKRQLFVYPETRGFLAPVGFDKSTRWLDDFPYLVVASPTLGLDTENEKWNERTLLFLDFAIFQK